MLCIFNDAYFKMCLLYNFIEGLFCMQCSNKSIKPTHSDNFIGRMSGSL